MQPDFATSQPKLRQVGVEAGGPQRRTPDRAANSRSAPHRAALMVREGARSEAIKRHLGQSSIIVTMDTYGHLFPSEAGALAEALNTSYHDRETDKRRTKGAARSTTHWLKNLWRAVRSPWSRPSPRGTPGYGLE